MKVNHPSLASNYFELAGDIRTGKGGDVVKMSSADRESRVLLEGKEGSPDNYKLGYGTTEGGGNDWTTPRHRHNFEQIRYPISGDYYITKDEILPAGWVAYFPESAYYGPQIKSANLAMMVIQMGGPSGNGYPSIRQLRQGFDAMVARGGVFEDGMYTWIDEQGKRHNQDASEARWEGAFGKPVEYPEPRYDRCIAMNPASFAWVKDESSPGVARKCLGTFTERELRIAMVQVQRGATLTFGAERAAEVMFMTEGALSHNGATFERLSAFGSEADDAPEQLVATEDAELLYVKLATF